MKIVALLNDGKLEDDRDAPLVFNEVSTSKRMRTKNETLSLVCGVLFRSLQCSNMYY